MIFVRTSVVREKEKGNYFSRQDNLQWRIVDVEDVSEYNVAFRSNLY